MQQVAEENGLDVVNKLAENPVGSKLPSEETRSTEQEDKLSRRSAIHHLLLSKHALPATLEFISQNTYMFIKPYASLFCRVWFQCM